MASGWRYRVASVLGTAVLATVAVTVVNYPAVQEAFALVPYLGRPAPAVLANGTLGWAILTTLAVMLATLWPVFKPRPRRILDTILLTQKRVVLAMIGLAALGYFDYSYRLPRPTLVLTTAFLLVVLPLYMVAIRRQPRSTNRGVIVGDDPETMADILAATEIPVLGYVSPPSSFAVGSNAPAEQVELTDGGAAESRLDALQNLGGLSRLDEVFVKHDIDTALLAFTETDRAEFFGTLDVCAEHGVTAMVHRDHADDVLTAGVGGGDLVEVELTPWDWQDYVIKRAFDVVFAGGGLLVLSPFIVAIAAAIKLDSDGPILYNQTRTAEFGDTFAVYKFRSMRPESEDTTPGEETDRVTRVGRILRRTHLDEIPQLWSILVGDMSVVGPRAAWTDEELLLEEQVSTWSQRWFVKPGLTGLAQINDVTSEEPREKLRYDIEYIRRQSFWLDLKIVVRQIWGVLGDLVTTVWRE
jgi:lipopolysaccharide/colanic/teichoic acid biosynthesis glycosyltransferase